MMARTTRRFEWSPPVVSVGDADPCEATIPEVRFETMIAPKRPTPASVEVAWVRTQLDVATQMQAVSDAMARATSSGMAIRELTALRRAFGGWTVLADALNQVCEEAENLGAFDPDSPCVKYVEAVQWWFARLTLGLGDLFANEPLDPDTLAIGILEACEFATLYALSHMAQLYDACERAQMDPLAPACARLREDVQWLTWQLKDIVDR
jgi:hypothetical protein